MVGAVAVGAIAGLAAGSAQAAGETIVVGAPGGTPFAKPDPVVASDFAPTQQLEWITCLQLVNYADPAGLSVQPEAAESMPTVTDGGTRYTFTVRSGLGFSPPSTETVSAASFEKAIQRVKTFGGGFAQSLVSDVVGMSASGQTLTIDLAAPDPGILVRLAMPYFCAVPSDAPMAAASTTPLASAGPYYVFAQTASQVDVRRNPNYGGDRVRNLGRIVYQLGNSNADNIAAAQNGTVDYVPQIGLDTSLNTSFGPASAAAAAGHQQYFAYPALGVQALLLNASAGRAFADLNLRKAVNYGVDRATIAGVVSFLADDQYLPTGIPGFVGQSFYPLSGNMVLASSYAGDAGVTPSTPRSVTMCARTGASTTVANDVKSELQPLGLNVTVQSYASGGAFFTDVNNPAGPCDLSDLGLQQQLADAVTWLRSTYRGGGVAPGVVFSSAALDQQMDDALALEGAARDAAAADIDAALSNAAALVPYATRSRAEFFSSRIGCQSNHPLYGVNLNRLCVRVADNDGSVSTGGDATPDAPLQTSVASSTPGAVTVTQAVTTEAPPNYAFGELLEQQLSIEAPPAPDPQHPLVLTFELDGALLAARGLTYQTVVVLRNGVAIDNCLVAGTLDPDPCVTNRAQDAQGDAVLTVLTSHASTWNFAASKALPTLDRPATAGGSIPVKFDLGGNLGLGVFAAGYPKSVETDCDTLEPTGAETAASGKLAYDASSGRYVYTWKTAKSYGNSCRRLELRFQSFPELTLNVAFRK